VAATNCLNFGNPEKPEIMAQLTAAIDGIADACSVIGTPITGGNVSLYNETRGEGIYPTPVLGIVGILDDVAKAVPSHFQAEDDAIILLWPIPAGEAPDPNLEVPAHPNSVEGQSSLVPGVFGDAAFVILEDTEQNIEAPEKAVAEAVSEITVFGSSEFAKVVLGGLWGQPPPLDLCAEADLQSLLEVLAERELLHSARGITDGGIAVALAQASFPNKIGAKVEQEQSLMVHPLFGFFAEPATTMLLSAHPSQFSAIEELATEFSFIAARIGTTGGDRLEISVYHQPFISAPIDELREPWTESLESTLHGEVTA
jgi:phosphoribosylformylglycinamidine synthase